MSEDLTTLNDLGTTDMLLRTVRASLATGIEVTSMAETTLEVSMTTRRVDIQIVGGAPGEDGQDAQTDPGDLIPIINALLNQGL